jgi:phosphatidylglycerol:prolipoprotein diacylglycerol transferase
VACLSYAPVRFALDFLRERSAVADDVHGAIDARYAYLTPAQWECFLLLGLGIVLLRRLQRAVENGSAFTPATVPRAFQLPEAQPSNAQA